MRRRIAVYGVTPEVLPLLQALARRAELDLVAVYDPDARVLRRRLALFEPSCAALLQRSLSDDPLELEGDPALDAVLDSGIAPPFRERFPSLAAGGIEVLTPDAARAAWLAGAPSPPEAEGIPAPASAETSAPAPERSPRDQLPDALAEIADSAELAGDPDALCARLLEAALAATGASRGSLLTLDGVDAGAPPELRVRAAVGLERELWPSARRPVGEGIAGRAAARGRALLLRGPVDREVFPSARERFDVAAALVVPLAREGAPLGVLCLHHPTRGDLFDDTDLRFAEALGPPAARLIGRALDAEAQRRRLACEDAAHETRELLGGPDPLPIRLAALCRLAAASAGGGSATLWLRPPERGESLDLAASSHAGGALAGAARLAPGEGLDGTAFRDGVPIALRRDGRLAYAALPMAATGVLAVQAGERSPAVDPEPVLAAIAAAAGRELGRIARESRAQARATRADALHEAALRLLALRDGGEIARFAAASAALGLDAADAIVRLREGTRFRIRASSGSAPESLPPALLALDRAAAREALRRGAGVGERDLGQPGEPPGRPLLAIPLRAAGEPLGTLAVYGRRSSGGPHAAGFDAEERSWLERLARYTAHALERADGTEPPRSDRAPLGELERRIRAEIEAGRPLAVVSVSIDGSAPVAALTLAGEGVRAHLGERDVAVDAGSRILVLLSEAEGEPEPVARLARAVAEHVSKHCAETEPRPVLAFGYARHPEDGSDARALLARASVPRIRML